MFDKFSDVLSRLAVKINANKYISTIKDSFIDVIPFIIVGSIGTLLGSVIFSTNGLGCVKGLEWVLEMSPWFASLNYATMNILALLIAYEVGKHLSRFYQQDESFVGLLSVVCFVLVSPTTLTAMFGEETQVISNVLSADVTNSKGLFVAMIIGMLSVTIFCKLASLKKLKITLPDAVPPNVAASFTTLLPTILTALIVSGFAYGFEVIVGTNLSTFIFNTLQTPIAAVFQHPLGIIAAVFFAALFWICGLHGASIVTGIINPITIAALQTNMDLVAAGKEATEIVTKPFWNMYGTMGGFGCTIGLIIAIFIAGKRDDDKAIAKLSLAPAFFGINEPVIFGIPIVLNPVMAIPFILAPVVCCIIGYASIYFGFAGKVISDIPWCLPPVVNGFIATGGDIATVITQLVCIAVTVVIYLPFVKIRNKEAQMENQVQ